MHKTHPTLTLLLTASVITAAACSLDVTLDPQDLRKQTPEENQTHTTPKTNVTLALGECTVQAGGTDTAKYSAPKSTEFLAQISYPDGCALPVPGQTPSINEVSHNFAGAQVVCSISEPFVLPSPAYVRVKEQYWLPDVQNFVTSASAWGSFFSQGSLSFRTNKGESLQLPGVRSSGLVFANQQAVKPASLPETISVSKLTASASDPIASLVFLVPSSCQIKGSSMLDLLSDAPEWKIRSIEISSSPDFQ